MGDDSRKLTARSLNGIQLTDEQKNAKTEMYKNQVIFLKGKAGTSKTFLAMHFAVDLLLKKQVKKIILCRPAVEAGKSLGALPGDLNGINGKLSPYMLPMVETFAKLTASNQQSVESLVEKKVIEMEVPQFLRGRNFENSVIIVDESQNLNTTQFKLILSRVCTGSVIVFTTDEKQIDLKPSSDSCYHVIDKIKDVEGVSLIELKENHRHPLAIKLIDLIDEEG